MSLISLFLFSALSIGQVEHLEEDLFFKSWDARDGLDDGPITALFPDEHGFLWVGSAFGLRQFDGRVSVPVEGLPHGEVLSISSAGDQVLVWIAALGLFSRNHRDARFEAMACPADASGDAFLVHSDNHPWLFQGASAFRGGDSWKRFELPAAAHGVSVGDRGIWVLAGKELVFIEDSGVITRVELPARASALLASDDGNVWLGLGSDLSVYDRVSGRRVDHVSCPNAILGIAQHGGMLWIHHSSGLARYDPVLGQFREVRPFLNIPDIPVAGLVATDHDVFWHSGHRLFYFQNIFDSFQFPKCEHRGQITSLFRDKDQSLWLGSDRGLHRCDGMSPTIDFGSSEGNAIQCIVRDEDVLWLGLTSGLGSFREGDSHITIYDLPPPFSDISTESILPSNEGLLIAGDAGCLIFDPVRRSLLGSPFLDDSFHQLVETRSGKILAVGNKGLWERHASSGVWKLIPLQLPIRPACMVENDQGQIWLGGKSGLVSLRLDPKPEIVARVVDLPHDSVLSLQLDRQGHPWITTPLGLARIDPQGRAVKMASWLPPFSLATNGRQSHLLTFADRFHVSVFNPDRQFVRLDPILHLDQVSWKAGGQLSVSGGHEVVLPNDHDHLSVRLIPGHCFELESVALKWRLSSEDPWTSTTGSVIVLGSLNAGNHVLQVRLQGSDTIFEAASFEVANAPFPWLWAGLVLLAGMVGYLPRRAVRTSVKAPVLSPVSGPPSAIGTGRNSQRPVILVVDDDPMNLQVIMDLLAKRDFQLLRAESGEEALAICQGTQLDMVLLDVMMPGMSGFEVCTRLRQQASLQELPVIFLTARASKQDLVRGFDAGGNDYLTKPIVAEELDARIDLHLQLREMHRLIQQEKQLLATEVELEHHKLLSREASLRLLHVQMNPHFLQNVLNTVSWLVISKPNGALEMLETLSSFLRKTFNATPKMMCTLGEELARIELFCKIQKLRFPDRLKTHFEIDPASLNLVLPNFLIQPLIENAILHGVEEQENPEDVALCCCLAEGHLLVEVSNSGEPLEVPLESLINDEAHALGNISTRLTLMYQKGLYHRYEAGRHTFGFRLDINELSRGDKAPAGEVVP